MHALNWLAIAAIAAALVGLYALVQHLRERPRRTIISDTVAIEIIKGDITAQQVDAIVNAAKPSLLGGGGVDGAIHWVGGPRILDECRMVRRTTHPNGLPTGQAVATTAGNLPATWVIHTVGPVYDPAKDQAALLRSCYTRSLAEADRLGAKSVAFPLISSGVYGWPTANAVSQALTAILTADTQVRQVRLVLFDKATHDIAVSMHSTLEELIKQDAR